MAHGVEVVELRRVMMLMQAQTVRVFEQFRV